MRLLAPLFLSLATLAAAAPRLLEEGAQKWLEERERWTFTQTVRESDSHGTVVLERVERYDATRGAAQRWQLVSLNGKPATADEAAAWSKRKNKPRSKPVKPLSEYVDLERAQVVKADAQSVSYNVPLRSPSGWIFPAEKVTVVLTIGKSSHAIERAQAEINAPFRVALGLAEVQELDLDLAVPTDEAAAGGDEAPQGTAVAVVNKLGRRVEYSWTDFALAPAAEKS
jgi:hypothetical protein